MIHAFTVDVEDWYHPLRFYCKAGGFGTSRLRIGMDRLIELLDNQGFKATFFWVAELAKAHPSLLRDLTTAGHEIGCHSLAHDRMVYDQTPEQFRSETGQALAILRDISGQQVRGYRAPCFSITARTPWAADILSDLGITYDSSIFPIYNWRYGDPSFSLEPSRIGRELWEFPMSARRLFHWNIPVSGGAYFRIYPYWLTVANFHDSERHGRPVVFYIHPWELDPKHPSVPFYWKARITHYVNLCSTESRLCRLLADFRFGPMNKVFGHADHSAH